METPILFRDTMARPGLLHTLPLSKDEAVQLAAWNKWFGFGTLEVLLAFAKDPASPASPQNHLDEAVLVELVLPEDIQDDTDSVEIYESRRVRINTTRPHPKHGHQVATWEEAEVLAENWDDEDTARFKSKLAKWLLAHPEDLDALSTEAAGRTLVTLNGASLSVAVYTANQLLAQLDPHALLQEEDLAAHANALEASLQNQIGGEGNTHLDAAAWFEQEVEFRLQDVASTLEAVSRLQSAGALPMDHKTINALRSLRKDVDKLIPQAQHLIETLEDQPTS